MTGQLATQYDYVGHLAYLLVFASFMLRDIIWLRVVAILAALTSVLYNYIAPATPLWVPIQWNIALVSVNLFQIAAFLHDQREVALNDKEKWLYQTIFSSLTTKEFKKLLNLGSWEHGEDLSPITTQGETLDHMFLIFTGTGDVKVNDETIAKLERGDLIGEMSFITGDTATATITLERDTEYLSWKQSDVRRLIKKHPSLGASLQEVVSQQLAKKISRSNQPQEAVVD